MKSAGWKVGGKRSALLTCDATRCSGQLPSCSSGAALEIPTLPFRGSLPRLPGQWVRLGLSQPKGSDFQNRSPTPASDSYSNLETFCL